MRIVIGMIVLSAAFSTLGQEQPRPPTIEGLQGALQVTTMQRDFAQNQAQSAAAQAMEMIKQVQALRDEIAKLKEPKK